MVFANIPKHANMKRIRSDPYSLRLASKQIKKVANTAHPTPLSFIYIVVSSEDDRHWGAELRSELGTSLQLSDGGLPTEPAAHQIQYILSS